MGIATDPIGSTRQLRAHGPLDLRPHVPRRVRVATTDRDDLGFFRGLILVAIPTSLLMWAGIVAGLRHLRW